MKKTLFKSVIVILIGLGFSACQKDELGPTIFDTTDKGLDPTSYTYTFDKYLQTEFLKPYNLDFTYKLRDVASDMDYNLIPASLNQSEKLAVLVKYLWFDVYKKVAGPDFLKMYGPRMIHLIGSPAYNPTTGTILLGVAEGGIKITLYRVNELDPTNLDVMNEYYFKTMHHEFAHILHQTKSWPAEFNLISYNYYEPYTWSAKDARITASLGFASPYGSSQMREDFVEIIANYIVKTDAQWNALLDTASKGWTEDADGNVSETTTTDKNGNIIYVDTDGVDGKATILKKLGICRTWFKEKWNIDLDALRAEVQYRQARIDMDSLLSEIK